MKSIYHYTQAIKSRGYQYINKRRGWTTDRKIIVIESDDWGSIRMPKLNTLKKLEQKGVKFKKSIGYDLYDTLESNDDLELLAQVLCSVKDSNGNPAIMTLNYLMTNPDFGKIRSDKYTEYHYELFTETLKRYPNHANSFNLLKEGIKMNFFLPQFHGREHLNVQTWLKLLQQNVSSVVDSFNMEVFSMVLGKNKNKHTHVLDAYNVKKAEEYEFIINSMNEGLNIFEQIFGYKSKSIIAPNYLWDPIIEDTAYNNGVNIIQGGLFQNYSDYYKKHTGHYGKFHYTGKKNDNDQVYITRNCAFEPSSNPKQNYESCLKDIQQSFRLNKPAIISSHRLNYIGGLNVKNRDENLKCLQKMLNKIIKEYPDVEFMSSDELGEIILKMN